MKKIQIDNFKIDHMLNTLVNEKLFAQWLRNFFYLNFELHKTYDSIYQASFYVKFHELISVGLEYSNKVLMHLENSGNNEKIEFYKVLSHGLVDLKSLFSESELQFIEYKRHSSSHIFQHHYENLIQDNGKIKTKRKGKLIDELNRDFKEILLKYGFDRGFDEYVNSKLFPRISELYERLQKNSTQHYTNNLL